MREIRTPACVLRFGYRCIFTKLASLVLNFYFSGKRTIDSLRVSLLRIKPQIPLKKPFGLIVFFSRKGNKKRCSSSRRLFSTSNPRSRLRGLGLTRWFDLMVPPMKSNSSRIIREIYRGVKLSPGISLTLPRRNGRREYYRLTFSCGN